MTRKRTPKTLLAAAIALQATLAQALGLGDIALNSALDQPLDAEIRLRGVGDLSASQILVGLASGADFERAGVERLYSLTEIRFEVELLPNGNGRIHLSTDRPVREPYLDFVVEVRWPTGRVLREYTVLLDLPTTTPTPPPVVRAPARAERSATAPARVPAGGGTWSGGDSYAVESGDTLWSIASRTRPGGVSVQQMMVALQRENPEAFIRGNMNLLRAGAILRIPADAAVSQSEALGEIEAQSRDWRSGGTPAPQPAAPGAAAAAGAGEGTVPDRAYLELAAGAQPGSGAAAGGVEGGTGGAPVDEQLAAVQENLSAKERENEELQSRVAALEEQVQTYERLVELNSEGAAAAQQAGGEASAGSAAPQQTDAPVPAPAAEAPAAPAPAQEPGLLARLMNNSLALGAAIAALFGGALAFVFLRRRQSGGYGSVPESSFEQRAAARTAAAAAQEPRGFRIEKPEVEEQEEPEAPPPVSLQAVAAATAAATAAAPVASAPAAAPAPEHRDPLSEADILIAYGRTERAEEVLGAALADEPGRIDVRLKLMELQAGRGDGTAVLDALDRIDASGDAAGREAARAILREHGMAHLLDEAEQPAGVRGLDVHTARRDEAPTAPAAPPAPAVDEEIEIASMEVDGDLSHLDAELALEAELAEAAAPVEDGDADLALELGELDFGGGLDDAASPAAELAADLDLDMAALDVTAPGQGVELEPGELGAEFGEPAPVAESASAAGAAARAPAAPAPEAGAEDDGDIGLLEGSDETETKLELARAYVDMGDLDGARDILDEVLAEGSAAQREQAGAMLERLRGA